MTLQDYKRRQLERLEQEERRLSGLRQLCPNCLQPQITCYCVEIERFDPKIKFVILIHPIEMKRRIASGRMSHLCLEKSELICGQDFSFNARVNQILKDCQGEPLVLYPGPQSIRLDGLECSEKRSLFPRGSRPVIFVIDGTWATARKTMRLSNNLNRLKRICFRPSEVSRFRVRKQPRPDCLSTIEAIYQTIELIGEFAGFDVQAGEHQHLLRVFDQMVFKQIEFIRRAREDENFSSYRRPMGWEP